MERVKKKGLGEQMAEWSMTIEDHFLEAFGGWKKDILSIERNSPDEIVVKLTKGRKYLFGRNDEGLYLRTISQKEPVS